MWTHSSLDRVVISRQLLGRPVVQLSRVLPCNSLTEHKKQRLIEPRKGSLAPIRRPLLRRLLAREPVACDSPTARGRALDRRTPIGQLRHKPKTKEALCPNPPSKRASRPASRPRLPSRPISPPCKSLIF